MTKSRRTFLIVVAGSFIGLGALNTAGFAQPILNAPFDLTLYFFPSGWMGDGESKDTKSLQLNTGFTNCSRSDNADGICIKIRYQPDSRGKGWAGIYWQYPDGNWGKEPGRKIAGAKRVVFWARGEKGDEVVEFKAGGIHDRQMKYQDTFEAAKRIKLGKEWVSYEIPLSGKDLSNVIGAFAWSASKDANPDGVTVYIDDIRYE